MILTRDDFRVTCDCGRTHGVLLNKAVIAPGALHGLNDLLDEGGYKAPVVAVYDENTWQATQGRHPKADREVVLKAEGLHADEHGVQQLLDAAGAPGTLVAIGAGTVHDITRYCAKQLGVPFVSAPTAASVDGLVSTVAAMTWKGFKVTLEAVGPALLVADLDVIARAPWRLTTSGVGDVLGKYVALCDWHIGHTLTGASWCAGIAGITRAAVQAVTDSYAGLAGGDPAAYASLTRALVMSGVAMQLAGDSRPASGAEHHISHLLELGLDWIGPNSALHGEKVGVGTLLCADEYHRWAAMSADEFSEHGMRQRLAAYRPLSLDDLRPAFGRLAEGAVAENKSETGQDCLLAVPPAAPLERWEALRADLAAIPPAAQVEKILVELGASHTLADLGVDEGLHEKLMYWAPYARNRLTFLRLRHLVAPRP